MRNTSLRNICREEIDPNSIYGIVLKENSDFVLVAKESDFFLDGYKILRRADISSSISTPSCRYAFKILKKEGQLKEIVFPDIDISTWHSIFRTLGRGKFISAEDEAEGDYAIGPIVRVNKNSVTLRYFDGTGKWGEDERIEYSILTCVDFENNYINKHEKYIQS